MNDTLRGWPSTGFASVIAACLLPGPPTPAAPEANSPLDAATLRTISARYLGKPYVLDSLGEGKAPDRDPLYDDRRVDCQTLVEQVFVDALTEPLGGRAAAIRSVRYGGRDVALENRLHYCLPDWLERPWPVVDITAQTGGKLAVSGTRRIDLLALVKSRGVAAAKSPAPARNVPFRYVPRAHLAAIKPPDGSIILFVHKRPDLIAAHLGFIFLQNGQPVLRHASQTRRKVIDEPLHHYLARAPKWMIGASFLKPDMSGLQRKPRP